MVSYLLFLTNKRNQSGMTGEAQTLFWACGPCWRSCVMWIIDDLKCGGSTASAAALLHQHGGQTFLLPPQLWVFWASSDKKRRWSWTLVARCPSWWWIWLTGPHSRWWRTDRRLCHDTQSSFTAAPSASLADRHICRSTHLPNCPGSAAPQLRARTRESQLGGTQRRNSSIWFLVYPVSSPCWRRDSFLDSRQKYVRTGWAQVELELEGLCPAFCPRKALQVFVLSFMVSIL